MPTLHAFELLANPPERFPDVVAVFGPDATLRSWSMQRIGGDADVNQFDGESVKWADLRDDLSTASLFDAGEKKTLLIRGADKFLSSHRGEIEKYLAAPGTAGRLVLELDSLASNTKVYKAIAADQLAVPCSASPDKKSGVTAASRRKFLTGHVADRHRVKLMGTAADALIEILGDEIGMLDTEIAKLALFLDPGGAIEEALVREVVAGWQGKTVWQITEAIATGNAAEALRQLDKLMTGGQKPIALLPQIAWSLRRLGMATASLEYNERTGKQARLEDAITYAGIRRPSEVSLAKKQLTGMGRPRAKQLLPWLLDADLRLKGTHSQDGRDRFLLEHLVLRLAKTRGK